MGLFALIFIIWLIIKIVNGFSENDKALNERLPSAYSIAKEDSNLIAKEYIEKMKLIEVYRSNVRNPIALISFDTAYRLIMYKINLSKDASLKSIIRDQIKDVDRSTGKTYNIIDNNLFYRFQYQAGTTKPTSKVYLTLSGDSLKTVIKNDSIFSYHLLCKNFSIRYDENAPIDIFVEGQESFGMTSIIPMDIMLLKRNKIVYLLVMTPNKPTGVISPNLLLNILSETKQKT